MSVVLQDLIIIVIQKLARSSITFCMQLLEYSIRKRNPIGRLLASESREFIIRTWDVTSFWCQEYIR